VTGANGDDGGGGADSRTAAVRSKKMRWVKIQQENALADLLFCAPYHGELPRPLKDWDSIEARMPPEDGLQLESALLKRHARLIVKSRDDLYEKICSFQQQVAKHRYRVIRWLCLAHDLATRVHVDAGESRASVGGPAALRTKDVDVVRVARHEVSWSRLR